MDALKWVGISFLIVGLVMLVGGGFTYVSTNNFLDISSKTEGIVTDLILSHSSNSRGSGVYRPVISFQTEKGENIEFKSGAGSNPPSYRKGDRVNVRYDPENPYHSSIDSFFNLWFLPLLLSVMGFIFSGIGSTFLVIGFRKSHRLQVD
jgi:hypothetical protein